MRNLRDGIDHRICFGVGRMVCSCGWDFNIPFNRSMSLDTVTKAGAKHIHEAMTGEQNKEEKAL